MDRIDDFVEFYKNEYAVGDVDPNIWMANYIVDRMELNQEQILWFCFLCSVTYQLPSAYLIINEYPDLENVGIKRLQRWWEQNQKNIPFQTDKLKQRKFLPESVESYKNLVGSSQKEFFDGILTGDGQENFEYLWSVLYKDIRHFGRFSVWNWAQMLKQVAGYDIEPNTLFLGESNAESHTHGICYMLGRDDWAKKERYTDENGKRKKKVHKFTPDDKEFLNLNTDTMISKLKEKDIPVDKYMVETVACAFKKLFRENDSRYIGYYLDRQAEDINKTAMHWEGVDWSILWDARDELLEKELLNSTVDKSKFKLTFSEKIVKYSIKNDLGRFF